MRRLLALIFVVLTLPASAQLTGVFVGATAKSGTGSSVTTSAVDTTANGGANYCLAHVASFDTPTISDSSGNPYTLITSGATPGLGGGFSYETSSPTTSATETWTATSGNSNPSIAVACFHNVASRSPTFTGGEFSGTSPFAIGSLTPPNTNEIIVAVIESFGGAAPTDSTSPVAMTIPSGASAAQIGGNAVAVSYQIQTTATAVNPTFSVSGAATDGTVAFAFQLFTKAAPATFGITTSVLPECFSGSLCAYTLPLINGVGPYTCTLASGTLPSGISLASTGGNTNNGYSGTHTGTVSATPLTFHCVDSTSPTPQTLNTSGSALTVANPLSVSLSGCTSPIVGTQGSALAGGCGVAGTGGTSPYTYSVFHTGNMGFVGIPEGIAIGSSSGLFSSSYIGGQGDYTPVQMIVTDSLGATATTNIEFDIAGNNPVAGVFPPALHFIYQGLDISNPTNFPIDTSPAAGALPNLALGINGGTGGHSPNGFAGYPITTVLTTQPNVAIFTLFGYYFTAAPMPSYQSVEGSNIFQPLANTCPSAPGDIHAMTVVEDMSGNVKSVYEQNPTGLTNFPSAGDGCNQYEDFLDPTTPTYTLPMSGFGTTAAAGTPITSSVANYDWVMSAGGMNAQLKMQIPGNSAFYPWYLWPGTASASPSGGCSFVGGPVPHGSRVSQIPGNALYPTSCTGGRILYGQLYRIPAAICASPPDARLTNFSTNPQAASIFRTMCHYGVRADDGGMFTLQMTNDSRWSETDLAALTTLNGLSDFEPVRVEQVAVNPDTSAQYTPISPSVGGVTLGGKVTFTGKVSMN